MLILKQKTISFVCIPPPPTLVSFLQNHAKSKFENSNMVLISFDPKQTHFSSFFAPFFYYLLPPEFLPVLRCCTHWCASTLGTALLFALLFIIPLSHQGWIHYLNFSFTAVMHVYGPGLFIFLHWSSRKRMVPLVQWSTNFGIDCWLVLEEILNI